MRDALPAEPAARHALRLGVLGFVCPPASNDWSSRFRRPGGHDKGPATLSTVPAGPREPNLLVFMPLPPLSPEQLAKPRHFEARIALIFAALFVPLGVHVPYFPLWLEAKGFDAEQIGIILAAPMFLRVLTTPLITAMADRAKDRANVLIALVAASLLLSLGYFLPPTYATVLAVSLALSIFWTRAFAARRFARAVGRQAVRVELPSHAHLGIDRLPCPAASSAGSSLPQPAPTPCRS